MTNQKVVNLADPTALTDGVNLRTLNDKVQEAIDGLTWKEPSNDANPADGLNPHGVCNAAKESWASYNLNNDTIYICSNNSRVVISSTLGIPNATETSPGKVQLSGEIG